MNDRLSDIRITVEPDPESFAEEIQANLLASLRQNLPASDYRPFGLLARTRDGEIQGAFIGGTSYGWLLVKILWVGENLRSQGLGARIMRLVEEEAVLRGCHGAWLDTSSRRARSFYLKLGYETFGTLENREGEMPRVTPASFSATVSRSWTPRATPFPEADILRLAFPGLYPYMRAYPTRGIHLISP